MNRRNFLMLTPLAVFDALFDKDSNKARTQERSDASYQNYGEYGVEGLETRHFTDADLTTLFLQFGYLQSTISLLSKRVRQLEERVPGAKIYQDGLEQKG